LNFDNSNNHKQINFPSRKEEDFLSCAYLILKVSLFLLSIVSLFRIGYVSKIRTTRLKEIKESYLYERVKFKELSNRFDDLISHQGEQRFMKDQYQIISKGILRVIWR
tara:strand:- start:3390 stop:3713 length:324 start_codon:yes stop_codon:yes gene_type:complete